MEAQSKRDRPARARDIFLHHGGLLTSLAQGPVF
jgi:hypothetical protein